MKQEKVSFMKWISGTREEGQRSGDGPAELLSGGILTRFDCLGESSFGDTSAISLNRNFSCGHCSATIQLH